MKGVLLRTGLLLLASLFAVAAWVAAASVTSSIPGLAAIALVAFCASGAIVLKLADHQEGGAPIARRRRFGWLFGGAIVYMVIAQIAIGRKPRRTLGSVEPVPGTATWTLSDGTRIAYLHVPARGPSRGPPILMLHDGPGIPLLSSLARLVVRPLDFAADSGFDVYYYDQRGAGLSDRLDLRRTEPYTVARHVNDLDEIRSIIGAEEIILAGHGWGSTLAINYLAEYPTRVTKLVLLAPAPLWYAATPDFVDAAARARINDVEASALAILERPPLRLLVGRLTATTSPRAAHTLVPDWEADQWWTRALGEALRLGQPRMTCRSDETWGLPPLDGIGFFTYSYTVADALHLEDPRPRLADLETPALVVRGLCDYVQGQVAQDYLDALPGSLYVAVPGAGHLIWTEQQSLLSQVANAFLLGRAVPLAFYAPRRSEP